MKHDFKYISKCDPKVRQAYGNLNSLIREVQLLVRDKFTFQFYPVGSYARNMITYDTKSNVGFDFDINIEPNDEGETYSAKQLRKTFQDALNQIAPKYGFDYPEGSTRVLTIKVKDRKNSRIIYSCDFAIGNIIRTKMAMTVRSIFASTKVIIHMAGVSSLMVTICYPTK